MADSIFDKMTMGPKPTMESKRNRLEPEHAPAFHAWKAAPTPETSQALITSVAPILNSATRSYGNSPNLQLQAKHMALHALGTYDPEKSNLKTHLMSHLQGLRRYSGQQDLPIRVPERIVLQHKTMRDTAAEFQDENGREPSDIELSELTGLSPKRLSEIRLWHRPMAEGHVTSMYAAQDHSEDGPGDPAVEQTTPVAILHDFIYSDLSPKDQLIMDYALGRNGRPQLSSRDIAVRVGVTPGLVSQRLTAIQQRLNAVQDMGIFGE